MRICIDARIIHDGFSGGVQQVIMGLAAAFGRFSGTDEFFFLAYRGRSNWLEPHLGANSRILWVDPPDQGWQRHQRRLLYVIRLLALRLGISPAWLYRLPSSDGTIEQAGIDVMHFVLQSGYFRSSVPSIYHPWDLQHRHYPELFTPYQRVFRETMYRNSCHEASLVSVATDWHRQDIVNSYIIPPDKVHVVPMAAIVREYQEEVSPAIQRLPERFLFYPAQTWPHKNHLRLIEALAIVRDNYGIRVPVVCTGHTNTFFTTIQVALKTANLEDQMVFLGYVSPGEVVALYRRALGLIFPSFFEGWGLPITEAFALGTPVACSNVTGLPEQVGDAALLFDPTSSQAIADAIYHFVTKDVVRQHLIQNGYARAQKLNWDYVALQFFGSMNY